MLIATTFDKNSNFAATVTGWQHIFIINNNKIKWQQKSDSSVEVARVMLSIA